MNSFKSIDEGLPTESGEYLLSVLYQNEEYIHEIGTYDSELKKFHLALDGVSHNFEIRGWAPLYCKECKENLKPKAWGYEESAKFIISSVLFFIVCKWSIAPWISSQWDAMILGYLACFSAIRVGGYGK